MWPGRIPSAVAAAVAHIPRERRGPLGQLAAQQDQQAVPATTQPQTLAAAAVVHTVPLVPAPIIQVALEAPVS
jgi:hypothetical protein